MLGDILNCYGQLRRPLYVQAVSGPTCGFKGSPLASELYYLYISQGGDPWRPPVYVRGDSGTGLELGAACLAVEPYHSWYGSKTD